MTMRNTAAMAPISRRRHGVSGRALMMRAKRPMETSTSAASVRASMSPRSSKMASS